MIKPQDYKTVIDDDIKNFSKQLANKTKKQFGNYPEVAVKSLCKILERGGKRVRGQLAMNSYYMCGGQNDKVALAIARVVELLHAYLLVIDDIQDRSLTRRFGPTSHVELADYHKKALYNGNSDHFGISIAINGALVGVHTAIQELCKINVDPSTKLRAIDNINEHFIATAHGQTLDIFNEVIDEVDEAQVDKVMMLKTAYYTFANPIELGSILAGSSDAELRSIRSFALHAGRLFQITDDIIGVFGSEKQTGKSIMDDIKEAKKTLLVIKSIENSNKQDVKYIKNCLGNKKLTQQEFNKLKKIFISAGALEYSKQQAYLSLQNAVKSINKLPKEWKAKNKEFLISLVRSMAEREA